VVHLLLATILPLAAAIALGFLWVKLGRPFDTATLGRLGSDIGMPCVALSTLANANVPLAAFADSALAAFLCMVALGLLGAVVLNLAGLRLKTYLPSVTWGNASFLGIPISLYAFGQPGLGYAVAFSAVSLVFNSIFSQAIAVGAANLREVLRNPLIYAIAIGVFLRLMDMTLPDCAQRSLSLLGGITVPVMLMMVGASIARIRAVSIGRAAVFSLLRAVGGGAVGCAIGVSLGLSSVALHVLILQAAMPVAVLSYVFAERWNNEPDEVASLVAVSTWSAAASVPLMLVLMMGSHAG
jgi:malate permease and related proteins